MYRSFGVDAAYYALAQAAVVIAFALVFATARPLVGATGALVAVLIIDGMHYFQYTAVKFNHDVIQLPFWALAGYAFMPRSSAGGSAIGCCSASPSAARCGRNISSSCWRRPMRCSCCSTGRRGALWPRPGRGSRCAVALLIALPHVDLAVPHRFPAVRLCRAPRRAGARLVRSHPAPGVLRRQPDVFSAAIAVHRRRAVLAAAQKRPPPPSPARGREEGSPMPSTAASSRFSHSAPG